MEKDFTKFCEQELPASVRERLLKKILPLIEKLKRENVDPSRAELIIQRLLDELFIKWEYDILLLLDKSQEPLLRWLFQCHPEKCETCPQSCKKTSFHN